MNKLIDHTILKADAKEEDIKKLCAEAVENNFMSVCVNPTHVELSEKLLRGSDVKVCTVVGFPLGASTTDVKLYETKDALRNGADEIDMVINVGWMKDKRYNDVENEIRILKNAVGIKVLKVIIETALLTDEEIEKVSELCVNAKADFVKTSTGFSTSGAKVEDVERIKKVVQDKALIKASGGIKSLEDAKAMVAAGASRLGTSSGIQIVEGE